MANGKVHGYPGLQGGTLPNNLSALEVSASQMDPCHSYGLWHAFTGCRPQVSSGQVQGFGDYEYHEDLAQLLGVHFTYSREDAQEQPGVNSFENSQIRLSEWNAALRPGCFQHRAGMINEATCSMLAQGGGVGRLRRGGLPSVVGRLRKYRRTRLPALESLFDQGFQVYASTMLQPDYWQAYLSGSKDFGVNMETRGTFAAGLTYFPFGFKEVRMNGQALYMDRSAVGTRQFRMWSAAPDGFSRSTLVPGSKAKWVVKFDRSTSTCQ